MTSSDDLSEMSCVGSFRAERTRTLLFLSFCEESWVHLSFLFSVRPSPAQHPPPPPHVCHGDHEELPPSSSCLHLPPLSEHAFPEGRLLFIPSGGLTVNLLHWGKFLGTGPISVGYFESGPHSGSRSVHLCVFALI